jgi:hypothetical protein
MPNAFPPKPGCVVPVVEAIAGSLTGDPFLCPVPDPIFEFPMFEFPPSEPPGFDFGCYEPEIDIDFDTVGAPQFDLALEYPDEAETGKCAPKFAFTVRIPSSGGGGGNATVRVVAVDNVFSLSGLPTLDCTPLSAGDTALLTAQADPAGNGMYTISAGAWARTADTVSPGMLVTVRDGEFHAGSTWQLNTEGPITPDTTPLTFERGNQNSVRVATTEEIALSGLQTIDDVVVADGDKVLVKNQLTNPAENGPYIARTGAWERVGDLSPGVLVTIREGSTQRVTASVLVDGGAASCDTAPDVDFKPLRAPGNVTVKGTFIGNVLLIGVQNPDGIAGAAGMRVLVKDNTTQSENGIYIMKATAWERTDDLIIEGMIVTTREGIRYRGTVFTLITNEPIVVDTTSLIFVPGQRTLIACDGASTADIVSLSGIQTIDGIAGAVGRVIMVRVQTTASLNGIYVMQTGAWGRTSDVLRLHMLITVREGLFFRKTLWMVDSNTPTFTGMTAFLQT